LKEQAKEPSSRANLSGDLRPNPGSWIGIAVALGLAAAFVAASTSQLLSPRLEQISRPALIGLMTAHVLIAIVCALLVGERVWRLFASRREGLAGSQLHIRLVGIFSVIAVAPAVVAFAFSALVLRSSLDEVFSERIGRAVEASRSFANGYFDLEANALGAALVYTQSDLQRAADFGVSPDAQPIAFHQYLASQAVARGFSALFVLDGDRRILDRVYVVEDGAALAGAENADAAARYPLPPRSRFEAVDSGEAPGQRYRFDAVDPASLDVFYGLMKADAWGGGYLVAYKSIPPDIAASLIATREVRDDYYGAQRVQRRLENIYALGFAAIALVILFGAVWLGLWAATALVRPIANLVSVAEKVARGDYDARAEVERPDSELGVLGRSFNRMTAQVQAQQNDLRRANAQVERRSRFTEAVLSGVSAGVVGIDAAGRATIANEAALKLLGVERSAFVGAPLAAAAPELADLVARSDAPGGVSEIVDIRRPDGDMTLNVRATRDAAGDGAGGSLVLTFDDMTELVAAQRAAAWGDVARRIAHEIKNPLTPIQLSAERLRRKYGGEIVSDPAVFERCTETIIRQVKDIGRMVDEFSAFARMPTPVLGRSDLRDIVREAVFDRRIAAPDIRFEILGPEEGVVARCDERLIAQALGNIVKNAAESVAERVASGVAEPPGRVRVEIEARGDRAVLTVSDNGAGLPAAERARLTEPYVTTRTKGTGLGLAIVKKIAEEHDGAFEIRDGSPLGPTGAQAILSMPLASIEARARDDGAPSERIEQTDGDEQAGRREPAAAE